MNEQLASIDQVKSTVVDLAIRFGPRLLAAILILVIGFMASRWVSRSLERALSRIDLEAPVRLLLARIAWALSLALLSNVMAGLSIIFTKPFRVGEYIALAGEEGQVEGITLFNTTLAHVDRSRVMIPNRKIVGEILHNFGDIRQLEVVVGVAYDTDLNRALGVINAVLQANPRVLKDPAAVVQTILLGEWSVNIGVRPWVRVPDYGPATGEIHRAVLEAFRSHDIVIPVPQREIHLIGSAA